jgi:hypothetical protein
MKQKQDFTTVWNVGGRPVVGVGSVTKWHWNGTHRNAETLFRILFHSAPLSEVR